MRTSRSKRRFRRWAERLLLVAGLGAIGVWAGSYACSAIFQSWENYVFEQHMQAGSATLSQYLAEKEDHVLETIKGWCGIRTAAQPTPPQPRLLPNPARPRVIGPDGLVGRLAIPRLHMRAIVREGASEGILSLGVGHIPGTALPGQGGNVGLAGHRDTMFRGLRKIGKNDLIQFETLAGNYTYQVESTQIVKPSTVSVLSPGSHDELTLVTCYPFYYVGSAPDRFIVKARQVSQNSHPPVVSEIKQEVNTPMPNQAHEVTDPHRRVREDRSRSESGVTFQVSEGHSRTLAPGISFGLSWTDASRHRVNGWMWIMPDRRTIWLKNQDAREPIVFYSRQDGKRRELLITSVSRSSVTGRLLLPAI